MYNVDFIVTENGRMPFFDFIECLTDDEQADIFASIDKLCDMLESKMRLPEKLSKYLNHGIFELKVSHSNRTSRCLYFYIKDKTIIFTHGFLKKTRKTPEKEIKRAIKLRNNYLQINLGN